MVNSHVPLFPFKRSDVLMAFPPSPAVYKLNFTADALGAQTLKIVLNRE